MKLYDAHNHLHDARLAPREEEMMREGDRLGIAASMVNGTREEDWPAVEALHARWPGRVRMSFGLHPWQVAARSGDWLQRLERLIQHHRQAHVGEIGLDRWKEGHDLPQQQEVFTAQLALAVKHERVVTVHCLKAWGALEEELRCHPLPRRGFLLHAYGGPVEMVRGLVKLGAYFSFSPYFLAERKAAARAAFREVPVERLLVETDAPEMCPPEERDGYGWRSPEGDRVNHPGNLRVAYEGLADLRGMELTDLAEVVEGNFGRLFGTEPLGSIA